jgi:hypothetical protein
VVYLLHLSRKLAHAQHYIGYVKQDLDHRLALHRSGRGSKLVAAVHAAGIDFTLARTWPGDRKYERRLKRRHCGGRLCPICSGARSLRQAAGLRPSRPARTAIQ